MNKINDRDLTELSSYWVYQDINKDNDFQLTEKDLSRLMNIMIMEIKIKKVPQI